MNRAIARELMDECVEDDDELQGNLRDIAFANAVFGGSSPVVRTLRRLRARRVLDVGCGAADIRLAIVRDGARRGVDVHVTCLDRSLQMLALARRATRGHPAFVQGEGEALPFPDGAFDIVTCTHALHHFAPDEARELLRDLRRVARLTSVVSDLRRSRLGLAAVWLWSRTSQSRLTRHDGPLSVRRAYTPDEALRLAREAGWPMARVRRDPFFRMTLTDSTDDRSSTA